MWVFSFSVPSLNCTFSVSLGCTPQVKATFLFGSKGTVDVQPSKLFGFKAVLATWLPGHLDTLRKMLRSSWGFSLRT